MTTFAHVRCVLMGARMTTTASRLQADLTLLKHGRPVVIVEAKGRVIPLEFRLPVLEQLRSYARAARAKWSVLVDPEMARIYQGIPDDEPAVEILSSQILATTGLSDVRIVGAAVLLLAIQRWLEEMAENRREDYDQLPAAFVRAVRGVDEFVSNAARG
jgi:hypothetical protein